MGRLFWLEYWLNMGWWYRLRARRLARRAAWRHLATVTQALLTGDTSAYHLIRDLPRIEGSTDVSW